MPSPLATASSRKRFDGVHLHKRRRSPTLRRIQVHPNSGCREFMAFFGVELCVGISYPTGVVLLVIVWIDIGIRHEVKEKNFHV